MEQEDSMVKTEVKIEIDVAEELPQSWYMMEKDSHVSDGKDVSTKNTACLLMPQTLETQVVPCNYSDVSVKQEVGLLPIRQTSDTQSSQDICVKQEVTEDQHNKTRTFKTDVKPEYVWTGSYVFDCGREPDTQGTVNTILIKQDNRKQSTCMLVCNTDTADFQRKDQIAGDEVGSINTQVMSCPQGIRTLGESLNYITAKTTSDVQPFVSLQPTGNSTQVTSAVCKKRGNVLIHTGQKRYGCQQCDAKFTRSSGLKQHLLIHTGQKPHACQQCDAKFTRYSDLKYHMLVHTGLKPYACQQCDAKFTRSSDLKCHVLMHIGLKPYACQQCDAKFRRSSRLKQHMLIHAGQTPFACQQCGIKFTQSNDLKRHMLIHTGLKPYACQQCDAKFTQSGNLKRHMLRHSGQKPHACQQCDGTFTTSRSLKRHMLIHTGQKHYA